MTTQDGPDLSDNAEVASSILASPTVTSLFRGEIVLTGLPAQNQINPQQWRPTRRAWPLALPANSPRPDRAGRR